VKGTAIVSVYNLNMSTNEMYKNTKYRVDYSEAGELGYDQQMVVSITGNPLTDIYSTNNLKMFVGKIGNQVDVYGNSNHPDLWLFKPTSVGYDWAFVARADVNANISVAQVALPPMTLTSVNGMFETYALKNVLSTDFHAFYDNLFPSSLISIYLESVLKDANAPAYFNNGGFVSSGTNVPSGFSNDFIDLSSLSPYVPADIMNLNIGFNTNIAK
jgi:hypothetical protein